MASKVKIADFVASTARYAKKSAAAADGNKDGKLSKTEAKALPKDLQDDYSRQAKTRSVTTASFATDQAAYVALASRQADKNHDGSLTDVEAAALPTALRENFANYAAKGTGSTGGSFVGKGKGKSDTLGGLPFNALPLAPAIRKLVAAASTDAGGAVTFGAAFQGKPADVARMLADPELNKTFFNDLLFHATGSNYQQNYPAYYGPDGLTISTPTSANAIADWVSSTTSPDGSASKLSNDVKALVAAINDPGTKLVKLSWTNHDDASFDGVFAVNASTGQIRAAGWMNEP